MVFKLKLLLFKIINNYKNKLNLKINKNYLKKFFFLKKCRYKLLKN